MSITNLKSLTRGAEFRTLLKLGFPIFVTQLGIVVVSFADTMMVGRYGTGELGASAFVNNFFLVPFVMLIGFASGITPLIGALFSRKENFKTGKVLRIAMRLNILVSLLFTAVMGILYFFLDRLGQPPELLSLIRPYYLIVLGGLIPCAIFNCFQQCANAVTDTAMPMWIILGGNCLNILGNWLLIFGNCGFPELGLTGAGIATFTARVSCMAAILLVVFNTRRYRPYLEGFRFPGKSDGTARKVFFTSLPIMVQNGIECALWSFGAVVAGWFGTVQLAAFQITNTMSQLGFMAYLSFGIAVSIRVANCTGVRDLPGIRRITRTGIGLNLLLAVVASCIFIFGGTRLLGVFTKDNAVILSAMGLLLPLVLYQLFDAVQIVYSNAIRGTSRVNPLMWASVIAYLAVGVPMVLFLAKGLDMGNRGVYYAFCIGILTVCGCLYGWYRDTLRRLEKGMRLD